MDTLVETPIRFSASRLKTWSACPLQAKFKYLDLLPESKNAKASYGTIIHHALKLLNDTGNLRQAIEAFKDLWANPDKVGLSPDWWPKRTTYDGLLAQGIDVLEKYSASLMWDNRIVLATEHPFLVPFGRFELTGFVDLLEVRRSGNGRKLVKVVDYKGGSWRPNQAELHLDIQFTSYLYAADQPEFWMGHPTDPDFPGMPHGDELYEEYKDTPRRAIWYHLNNQQEIDAGKRTEEDYARLYRLAEETIRAQEAGVFVPRIGEACGLCSWTKECGITIPTKEQIREDPDAWL